MPLSPLGRALLAVALSTALSQSVNAQVTSCSQFGTLTANGTCECPSGFGGADCSQLICSNPLVDPSARSLFNTNLSGNATAGCNNQCTEGFEGANCGVCTSNAACATAAAAQGGASFAQGLGDPVCSSSSWTWTQGFGSCAVVNPTLQSVFPGTTSLTFDKTVSPANSLSKVPGANNSITAALFYSAPSGNTTLTEQFYCAASSCVQSNITTAIGTSASQAAVSYLCQDLKCRCNSGTAFCDPSAPLDLTDTFNGLSGSIEVTCDAATGRTCSFKQSVLNSLFGQAGLALNDCRWGECVLPATINSIAATFDGSSSHATDNSLSGGVIAGLAVLAAVVALLFALYGVGLVKQRKARRNAVEHEALLATAHDKASPPGSSTRAPIGIRWSALSYSLPASSTFSPTRIFTASSHHHLDGRTVLPSLSGTIPGGSFTSILGPSGAGKSTLVDLLAGVRKAGRRGGHVEFILPNGHGAEKVKVGYVDQHDSLPATSTVKEAITFAADLRMGEISKETRRKRVFEVMAQLGLLDVADSRIGSNEKRGISGGERRRVSIALELVAAPAILIADEPTSGLDSTSALLIIRALKALTTPAPDSPTRPTTVILTIHQPSSQIFHHFDQVILLGLGGLQLYAGSAAESRAWFAAKGYPCPEGWNPADYLLDLASAPPRDLAPGPPVLHSHGSSADSIKEVTRIASSVKGLHGKDGGSSMLPTVPSQARSNTTAVSKALSLKNQFQLAEEDRKPSTVTLTQFEVLSGREIKNLRRDWSLFFMHNIVAVLVGVIVGGMYFHVDLSIGGFQSRIGSLFFLGCLLAFASLSALANFSHLRSLFLRERARAYYSPFAWVTSRIAFDMIPLRLIPTILLGVIVYWMVGLAPTAAHFFKFLLILVLYSIAMTLFNFLLAALVAEVGIAILISSVINLFQMAFAGFFINLSRIPAVLRWLQWLSPLKYMLEALSVNEVSSGLMIIDELAGAKVQVSAEVIMSTLFGFKFSAYYRDVLVLFGFIAGFAVSVVGAVVFNLRELR